MFHEVVFAINVESVNTLVRLYISSAYETNTSVGIFKHLNKNDKNANYTKHMTNPTPLSNCDLIIYSDVLQPRTHIFWGVVWLLIKIKAFIEQFYRAILALVWREFKHSSNDSSSTTTNLFIIFSCFSILLIVFPELSNFFPESLLKLFFILFLISLMNFIGSHDIFNDPHSQEFLLAFILLFIFSLLFYRFENLDATIIALFFLLWGSHFYLVKRCLKTRCREKIWTKIQATEIIWQYQQIDKKKLEKRWQRANVTQIYVVPFDYTEGIFHLFPISVWQVFLILPNDNGVLIFEASTAQQALQKAAYLKKHLKVPIEIANSEGQGDYVADRLTAIPHHYAKNHNLWKSQENANTIAIYKCFSWNMVSQTLKSILSESGIFLFTILLTVVMRQLGQMLLLIVQPNFDLTMQTSLQITKKEWLHFDFGWLLDLTEFTFAISALLYSGWKHSRRHQLLIKRRLLSYQVANQTIAWISLKESYQLLLVRAPRLVLLLIDSHHRVIEIDHLENEEEYEILYRNLLFQLQRLNHSDEID